LTTPSAYGYGGLGDPIPVPIYGQPQQICPPLQGVTILILNQDSTNNLYVGRSPSMTVNNSLLLAPGASINWDASAQTYAFTDATEPPIIALVSPGTSTYNLGPQQIISTIDIAALAASIALAISQTGVSFLAAPTPLYGGTIVPPPGGASLVGATVGYNLYGGNNTNGATEQAAITTLIGYLGRPLATQASKFYMNNEGIWPTSIRGDIQQQITDGVQLLLSLKPGHTASGTYSDTTVTVGGTTCLQEKTSLTNTINMFKTAYVAAGFPANSFKATLYQEPEATNIWKNNPPSFYVNMFTYYQTAIAAAGIDRAYNPGSGAGEAAQASFYPGDANTDVIFADYYGEAFNSGVTLTTVQNLADNHLPGRIPLGIGEMNAAASRNTSLATIMGYWSGYWNYVLNFFNSRLSAGKTNSWIMAYFGFSVGSGGGNSQPIVNDQINSISDFKITGFQTIYDALSSTSTSGSPTIAAGATLTVTPLNPTAGGNFALANGLSYDVSYSLEAGAGSTIPFATVSLEWLNQDSGQAQAIARQRWSSPMGATAGTIIDGVGPQHGQFLRVRITNNDTVTCTVVNFMLNATGRQQSRHNWFWDAPLSTPLPAYAPTDGSTFQGVAGGQSFGASLGSLNAVNIPAGAKLSWLFSVFQGSAYFRFNATGGGTVSVTVHPQPGGVWGQSALLNESPTGEFETIMTLPRAPCLVTINNTDTVAHTANVEIIALDPI
jgi:hypothetical protein